MAAQDSGRTKKGLVCRRKILYVPKIVWCVGAIFCTYQKAFGMAAQNSVRTKRGLVWRRKILYVPKGVWYAGAIFCAYQKGFGMPAQGCVHNKNVWYAGANFVRTKKNLVCRSKTLYVPKNKSIYCKFLHNNVSCSEFSTQLKFGQLSNRMTVDWIGISKREGQNIFKVAESLLPS